MRIKIPYTLLLVATLLWSPLTSWAQWLTYDQDVHQQLSIQGGGVSGLSPLQSADDTTSAFVALKLPMSTNALLNPSQIKQNTAQFAIDARTYYQAGTLPNCNAAQGTQSTLYTYCVHARNVLASQLATIRKISQTLEARNTALLKMLQNNRYGTLAQLQQKHYEMGALQTLISNDQMRLQTALAAYQSTRELLQLQQAEALQQRVGGKTGGTVASAGALSLIATSGLRTGKQIAQQVGKTLHVGALFDRNAYVAAQAAIKNRLGMP